MSPHHQQRNLPGTPVPSRPPCARCAESPGGALFIVVEAKGRRMLGLYVGIWLIPGVALCLPPAFPAVYEPRSSRPYLAVVGPPSLRFRETIEAPPDLSTRPPAGAPPYPAASLPSSSPQPVQPEVPARSPASSVVQPAQPPAAVAKLAGPAETQTPVAPIIPDEARPKVRPEDFLPYFQFPGSEKNPEDVSNVPTPPQPGVQPPSSAIYRQQ